MKLTEAATSPPPADPAGAVLDRLARIEGLLDVLVGRAVVKDWYTVDEFAAAVGLRPYTVREHCRLGRLAGAKKGSGRGKHQSWAVSHGELLRFRREGLRPARGDGGPDPPRPAAGRNPSAYSRPSATKA